MTTFVISIWLQKWSNLGECLAQPGPSFHVILNGFHMILCGFHLILYSFYVILNCFYSIFLIIIIFIRLIIIIIIMNIIIIILITLEMGPHFSNLPSFFNINIFPDFARLARLLSFFPEILNYYRIVHFPVFLNIIFPGFQRLAGNSDYHRFFNSPVFLNINFFPDY